MSCTFRLTYSTILLRAAQTLFSFGLHSIALMTLDTPILDAEESRPSSLYQGSSSKSRNNSHTANALPSSSRSSVDPRRSYVASVVYEHMGDFNIQFQSC